MSAKEPNDIERMQGLLSTWQEAAAQGSVVAQPLSHAVDEDLPPFDIKWAAGLFDGEGCIHIVRQRNRRRGGPDTFHLRVTITQNDRPVLEHFQRGLGVGGHIYEVARQPNHSRQVYTLNYATADTIALLQRLGPHLVRKRAELNVARRFWLEGAPGACPGPRGTPADVRVLREQLFHEMRRLKRDPAAG